MQQQVDVLEPIALPREKGSSQTKILALGKQAYGFHCFIVHADADSGSPVGALAERYLPGQQLLEAEANPACPVVLPLIPVHMTEAWMLADPEALLMTLNTPYTASQLQLPSPAGAERKADPKAFLEETLRTAQSHLKRKNYRIELADLYALLADTISLERLSLLGSYRQFEKDLEKALRSLQLLR